jgi:hypothetical protein
MLTIGNAVLPWNARRLVGLFMPKTAGSVGTLAEDMKSINAPIGNVCV